MKKIKIRMMILDSIPLMLAWILLIVLLAVVLAWNIKPMNAYLEDQDEAVNTIVIGKNEITVEEVFDKPEEGKRTVKKPMAKNVGNTECYVRGRVLESDSRLGEYVTYYNGETPGFNQNGWIMASDGWMYYRGILKPDESTLPLFTHIELLQGIPENMLDFTIDVIFESVQSRDFSNAREAFWALGDGGTK